jgi:2-amino-4-hydroxy-6-hydroxymethyldihydropteridine diphosphokinase
VTVAVSAYVGLGSNLESPRRQITTAVAALDALPGTSVQCCSSLYRSAPVGYADQPDFVNAVARVQTRLSPRELLDALLAIEREHGRTRTLRNGPRTLDLDLLLHGDAMIDAPGLQIPHPRLAERAFVVVPLAEIAPALMLPDGLPVAELARQLVASQRIERMDDGLA